MAEEEPTGIEFDKDYEDDQKEFGYLLRVCANTVGVPPLDPEHDYVINIGCGGSPDYPAIQTLKELNKTGEVPVVGIDLALLGFKGDAKKKLRHGDQVELIKGDASIEVPRVIERKGKPLVMIARNVDALYRRKPESDNPQFQTADWIEIAQKVFDGLNDNGGYFITTYKSMHEYAPLAGAMTNAGFFCIPIEKPDRRSWLQKIKAVINFEIPNRNPESDAFMMVGVKNISDELLARVRRVDPTFTRESLAEAQEAAKRQKEQHEIYNRYQRVNTFFDKATSHEQVEVLLNILMRNEAGLPDAEIEKVRSFANSPGKKVVCFSDFEHLEEYLALEDHPPTPATFWKDSFPGAKRRFVYDTSQQQYGEGQEINDSLVFGYTTMYGLPKKGETPTGNEFLLKGEVVRTEIIRMFGGIAQLETIEKLIEITLAKRANKK